MATVDCSMVGQHPGQQIDEVPSEKKKYIPASDPLGLYGKQAGTQRLYRMDDGRIYAEFNEEFSKVKVLYASEHEAASAFVSLRQERAKLMHLKAGMEAFVEGQNRPVERVFDAKEMDSTLRLDQLIHGELKSNLTAPETFITGKLRASIQELLPVKDWLKTTGENGRNLTNAFERLGVILDMRVGKDMVALEKAFAPLSQEEVATVLSRMVRQGQQARPEVAEAYRQATAIVDRLYSDAEALGVPVAPRLQNYMPNVHNMRRFTDPQYLAQIKQTLTEQGHTPEQIEGIISHSALGKDRGEALQDIMNAHRSAGNQITLAEATSIFDRHIQNNLQFISGHLERDRISSIPPIEDARITYSTAIYKNARRLAEAQVFGAQYEKAYALLDGIRAEAGGGERAFLNGRKAFDLQVGHIQERMPPWLEAIYDWQGAKLTLSVLQNLSQPVLNLPARVGLSPTWKAFVEYFSDRKTAVAHAQQAGGFLSTVMDQVQMHGVQAMLPAEEFNGILRLPMKALNTIKDGSLYAFNLVERMNRTVAILAGEHYFDQQVAALGRDATDKLATLRLKELGFESNEVLAHILEYAKTPNEGLLPDLRTLAGKKISDQTQFTSRIVDRPLLFQGSPVGKVLYQFKQFSVAQTEFMINNLMAYKRGDTERTVRTIGLILTAFPAISGLVQEARSIFTGESPTTKSINKFLESPGVLAGLSTGATIVSTTGTLGLLADFVGTAMQGNSYAIGSFANAPVLSTAMNVTSASASVIRGMANQDMTEFGTAAQVAGRELGGLGGALVKAGQQAGVLPQTKKGLKGQGPGSGLSGLKGL